MDQDTPDNETPIEASTDEPSSTPGDVTDAKRGKPQVQAGGHKIGLALELEQ
jgi:hypothetical protein